MSSTEPGPHASPQGNQDPTAEGRGRNRKKPARKESWADRAAQARTADDERAVAPHDRAGVPSTGDQR
ncbi:hypothetical protein [Plantactinospora sp. GCM10030261]|uniref:hypothetical protein n=1 Tax=Plantactinospora sp. GCM10030261 TaxID=3273420 RepID=UPI003614970F